jgi:hypothetical protein
MPAENRPYTWTMSVSTLDGYISFKDPGADGAKEIALAHIKDSGSIAGIKRGWEEDEKRRGGRKEREYTGGDITRKN